MSSCGWYAPCEATEYENEQLSLVWVVPRENNQQSFSCQSRHARVRQSHSAGRDFAPASLLWLASRGQSAAAARLVADGFLDRRHIQSPSGGPESVSRELRLAARDRRAGASPAHLPGPCRQGPRVRDTARRRSRLDSRPVEGR